MAIRWDPVLARDVARELSSRLEGSRVRGFLMDAEPRNLVLYAREWTLAFELHPTAGYLQLLDGRDPPAEARAFASRLRSVRAVPDDRILRFSLRKLRGRAAELELVVLFVGNRWNALAVEGESRTIRHVLVPRTRGPHTLQPGEEHVLPGGGARQGAEEPLSEEAWLELLLHREAGERRRTLLRNVAYTSSLNAPALLGRAALEDTGGAVEEDLRRGWRLWRRLRWLESPTPILLRGPRGPQPYPYPIPLEEGDEGEPPGCEETGSLLAAFGKAREEAEPGRPSVLLPSGLLRDLDDEIERAAGRLRGLERERADAPDPAPLRATGDLLLARFHAVPTGAEEVELTNFEGETVRIPLNPELAPHQNASAYYERAQRAERARERLPGLIRKAERRLSELRGIRQALEEGSLTPDEAEARAGVERARRRSGRRGRPGEAPARPYRSYRSSGGVEIRVGKGARANDDLTFHHSDPDDVWMHARHAAGAHVILRWKNEGTPPPRDLGEAAVLAALHSEARTSGSVPVDWTRRKYVRKPRKAPPGAVTPDRVQTVFVEPDPRVEKRLRAE